MFKLQHDAWKPLHQRLQKGKLQCSLKLPYKTNVNEINMAVRANYIILFLLLQRIHPPYHVFAFEFEVIN